MNTCYLCPHLAAVCLSLQSSYLLMMVAIDTTHNGRKGGLMATTLIHLGLFSAGPSQHGLILEHLHILHQPFPYPGQALGMGISSGNTRRCLLQQYYPVPTALPHLALLLRMWTGCGHGLHHPFPTFLLLSGPLGLAIPIDTG